MPESKTREAVATARPAGRKLAFASARDFLAWLAKNHASSSGIWLVIGKKGAKKPSITYAEAVDAALAWGWIDGQKRPSSSTAWLQRFTRRAARSPWSKINREKASALSAAGKMAAPGLREIERAKADGRWERAYDSAKSALMPDDFSRALAKNARAKAFYATINAANRYAIHYRIQSAKKPETRARRIAEFVAMLARKKTIH